MKKAIGFIAILAFFGAMSAVSWAGDTVDEVRKAGKLVAGVRDDVPPFGFVDKRTGEVVGVDVDLAAAVARKLGVRLETRTVTASTWIQDLVGGKVDLVAGTVMRTPDRAKVADFSSAYFLGRQRILARKGAVSSLSDLEGKKIGTMQGQSSGMAIKEAVPSSICYFFVDSAKAMEALRKGEVDAISASGPNLYGCASALPKEEYEISDKVTIPEDGFRMAVRKGNPKFLEVVNTALADLKDTGEARTIFDKWFRKGAEGTATAALIDTLKATGIVSRPTATQGRYLVLPESGTFIPSAAVIVMDPQGNSIGSGVVSSIYEDEIYIDVNALPPGVVQAGSGVLMNYSKEEAQGYVAEHKDLIEKVRAETRAQADRDQKEIERKAEAEKAERARYQEDMTKTKMIMNYQYGYYGYPYYWR